MSQNTEEILTEILSNRTTKRYLLSESFFVFIRLYLKHYFRLGIPLFQEDMIRHLENRKISALVVTSFIGGGKTTIISMAYLLWEAFRTSEKKIIVHVSRTRDDANDLALRIQRELLWNNGIADTYGECDKKLMTRRKIELPKVNTVTYFTHLYDEQFNYDIANVLIIDDAFSKERYTRNAKEEFELLRKMIEGRDYDRVIVSSSMYNREGVMSRLLLTKKFGKKLSYPIVDDSGQILWEEKFSKEKIQNIRNTVGENQWHKSYLLDLRTVRYMHYWMADRGHNWSHFKNAKEKKAYHEKWYKNTMFFDKNIVLGKYKFSSPKFGQTHVFRQKGEVATNDDNWFD